jgi:hypothetical protein
MYRKSPETAENEEYNSSKRAMKALIPNNIQNGHELTMLSLLIFNQPSWEDCFTNHSQKYYERL